MLIPCSKETKETRNTMRAPAFIRENFRYEQLRIIHGSRLFFVEHKQAQIIFSWQQPSENSIAVDRFAA